MRTEPEILAISDIAESLMIETCIKTGLGKPRLVELALFVLAEKFEFKDKYILELVDAWKKNRTTMEIAEDALQIAKLKDSYGK